MTENMLDIDVGVGVGGSESLGFRRWEGPRPDRGIKLPKGFFSLRIRKALRRSRDHTRLPSGLRLGFGCEYVVIGWVSEAFASL